MPLFPALLQEPLCKPRHLSHLLGVPLAVDDAFILVQRRVDVDEIQVLELPLRIRLAVCTCARGRWSVPGWYSLQPGHGWRQRWRRRSAAPIAPRTPRPTAPGAPRSSHRRCSKLRPEWASSPHRYARRTQRDTTWYQGVSLRLTRLERGCGISLPPSRFESMRTAIPKAYDPAAATVNKVGVS
jgi:hypothetical protein